MSGEHQRGAREGIKVSGKVKKRSINSTRIEKDENEK
jgi:hypothetical protein